MAQHVDSRLTALIAERYQIELFMAWKKTSLHSVADIRTGLSKSENRQGELIQRPYLRVANVQDGYIDLAELKMIGVPVSHVDRYTLQFGDVVVTEGGDADKLGRGAVWTNQVPNCIHQNHVFAIRVKDRDVVDPWFLAAQLQSPYGRAYFLSCSKQTTNLASINALQLRQFPILLPDIHEQYRVSDLLQNWDTAIDKTEQLIAAKRQIQKWRTLRLYTLSDVRGTSTALGAILSESRIPGNQGITAKKLTVKLYGKGVVPNESQRFDKSQTQYYRRNAGQLVYSKLDFLNGAFGLIPPELDGYGSTQDLPAFDIHADINPSWLIGYLTQRNFYKRHLGIARGQRKARRVNPTDLLKLFIRVPPRPVQDAIASALLESNCEIKLLERQLDNIKLQKRGLMQKLLTGQWRLPSDVPEEATCS